jgi:hypothetical protein
MIFSELNVGCAGYDATENMKEFLPAELKSYDYLTTYIWIDNPAKTSDISVSGAFYLCGASQSTILKEQSTIHLRCRPPPRISSDGVCENKPGERHKPAGKRNGQPAPIHHREYRLCEHHRHPAPTVQRCWKLRAFQATGRQHGGNDSLLATICRPSES